jgi:hypothetical protein
MALPAERGMGSILRNDEVGALLQPTFSDSMVLWFYVAAPLINLVDNPGNQHV